MLAEMAELVELGLGWLLDVNSQLRLMPPPENESNRTSPVVKNRSVHHDLEIAVGLGQSLDFVLGRRSLLIDAYSGWLTALTRRITP